MKQENKMVIAATDNAELDETSGEMNAAMVWTVELKMMVGAARHGLKDIYQALKSCEDNPTDSDLRRIAKMYEVTRDAVLVNIEKLWAKMDAELNNNDQQTMKAKGESVNATNKAASVEPIKSRKEVKKDGAGIGDMAYVIVVDGIIEALREMGYAMIDVEWSMQDACANHSDKKLRELKNNMQQLQKVTTSVTEFSINEINNYFKFN